MRKLFVAVILIFTSGTPALALDAALGVRVNENVLANGLRILVVERRGSPEVACRIFYNVGSANEVTGVTGVSHLCEHMMFKGTRVIGTKDPDRDAVYGRKIDGVVLELRRLESAEDADPARLEGLRKKLDALRAARKEITVKGQIWRVYMENGATGMNAFTSQDYTGFIVKVPSNKVELFFWMESDRMANAVFREFYSELDVVKEERRLRENSPTGFFHETFGAVVYDAHPYMHPVIGWMADLDKMTLAKARKYHDTYYVPNNAVVALVGDVESEEVFKLAVKYFGRIPRGADPPPVVTSEHPQRFEKRVYGVIDTQPFVTIAYHVPSIRHPDIHALRVLQAVLSGNAGRLYKKIVREKELATSCGCSVGRDKFPGTFGFHGTAKGGHTPEEVEEAIYRIIEDMKNVPVPGKELDRAKKRLRARLVRMLASNGYLATVLAASAVMHDWRDLLEAPARIARVKAEDVMRVAKKYFVKTNRTVGIVTQGEKPAGPKKDHGEHRDTRK